MIIFSCPTCESKLLVKDEKLIGNILACPKCGGMVLVQPSDNRPPPTQPPKPTVHKRFPDVLSNETASGIIGQVPEENPRVAIFLEGGSDSDVSNEVSETEIKTRKILVYILAGLLAFLLIVLGFLMLFQKPDTPSPPEQPKPPLQPIIEIPPKQPLDPPIEPGLEPAGPDEDVDVPLPSEELSTAPEIPPVPPPEENHDSLPHLEESHPVVQDEEEVTQQSLWNTQQFESAIPDIDIDAKLALPILELNFHQRSLIEFVRTMSRLTGIPITLNIDEMKPIALSVSTPVNGQFTETTAGQVLTETLASLGLQWIAVDKQILISPNESHDDVDLMFDVSDFAEQTDDLTSDVLAEMIRRLVSPDASIAVLPDNRLEIILLENNQKSPSRNRYEVQRFLEQLRVVRQLPQQSEWREETLAPEAFGWDEVMKPIVLNFYQAVPLSRALAMLETITNLTIIIDHQSFHRALCPFASVQAMVLCNSESVNDAVELLLDSVDTVSLAYRIIDHQTLEITTAAALRPDKMVMEVHRYQLREEETPEDIVRSLRWAIAPDSWVSVLPESPETKLGGDIVIDIPSGCLFVRQSQPVQRQIRLYLSAHELSEP